MRALLAVTLISTITFTALTNWAECVAGDCVNGIGSWFGAGGNKYVGEFKNGRPGGVRTHDQRIKSPLLYQLSYRPTHIQSFTLICK